MKDIEIEILEATKLLSTFESEDQQRRKPIIPHSIRVGKLIEENDGSRDAIIAGLLHDTLEWSNMSRDIIETKFGSNVLAIVEANTQNRSIQDKIEQWKDMVNRCADLNTDALIVKAADTLDSLQYYKEKNNEEEIARSIAIGNYIIKNAESVDHAIINKLRIALK